MANKAGIFVCRFCGLPLTPESWGGAECWGCGSICANEIPTLEELSKFYSNYNQSYRGGSRPGVDNQLRYARRYLKICRKHVSLGRLVDVGSSTNPFPNLASEAGFEVTVIDFTRPQCLREGVAWVEASLNDNRVLTQYQERFDVVSAWAVLEHVVDPKLAVKVLAGLCCNGGTIFLSTPEIGTFLTRHAGGHSGWFSPPSHLHLVSAAAMIQLFTAENCALIRQGRIELNLSRWLARYGLGLAEAVVGLFLRYVFPRKWCTMRRDHTQKFKGIRFFVFKKVNCARLIKENLMVK